MTYSDTQPRGTLRYRLLAASLRPADSPLADPGDWGHEYVRHLAAELGEEYTLRDQDEDEKVVSVPLPAPQVKEDEEKPVADGEKAKETKEEAKKEVQLEIGTGEDLRNLGLTCAKFLLKHNAEADAVDLLEELEIVESVVDLLDENTYARVAAYIIA